jgi:hypothetical protein
VGEGEAVALDLLNAEYDDIALLDGGDDLRLDRDEAVARFEGRLRAPSLSEREQDRLVRELTDEQRE